MNDRDLHDARWYVKRAFTDEQRAALERPDPTTGLRRGDSPAVVEALAKRSRGFAEGFAASAFGPAGDTAADVNARVDAARQRSERAKRPTIATGGTARDAAGDTSARAFAAFYSEKPADARGRDPDLDDNDFEEDVE